MVSSVESLWAWKPDAAPAEPADLVEPDRPDPVDLGPLTPGSPYRIILLPGNRRRSRHPLRTPVFAALVAVVIAICAALPWAVPKIPDMFADAVPQATSSPLPTDPPIDSPTPQPTSTTTTATGLLGKLLASAGRPLSVAVPRLHVDSEVIPISGSSGSLIPPSNPQQLGWWMEGRGVGVANGSAVVTGHTVSTGGGAFDHLGELVPGDVIRVRTAAGSIDYVVQQVQDMSVDKLARTAAQIFSQTIQGRLVLITCSDFNGQVYLSNSVVYALPTKDEPNVVQSPSGEPGTATP